jgi:anti-sigma factor RsiW
VNPSEASTRLNDYLEGDLPAAERSQLERTLAAHPELRAELAELRATVALLQRLREPEVPPFLAERVIARVRAGEAEPESWWHRLLRRLEPRVGLPLAAGLAGLALFPATRRRSRTTARRPPQRDPTRRSSSPAICASPGRCPGRGPRRASRSPPTCSRWPLRRRRARSSIATASS